MTVTLDEAIALIQEKRRMEAEKHMKFFLEDPKLEIMKGLYGPYLSYDGQNYRLPKDMHENAKDLTYEQCMKVIEDMEALKSAQEKKGGKKTTKKTGAKKTTAKKTTKKETAEA